MCPRVLRVEGSRRTPSLPWSGLADLRPESRGIPTRNLRLHEDVLPRVSLKLCHPTWTSGTYAACTRSRSQTSTSLRRHIFGPCIPHLQCSASSQSATFLRAPTRAWHPACEMKARVLRLGLDLDLPTRGFTPSPDPSLAPANESRHSLAQARSLLRHCRLQASASPGAPRLFWEPASRLRIPSTLFFHRAVARLADMSVRSLA
ncbi:hypothetical protein BV20DRAFT_123089 [Pilatotrama ljubarskyi]|nr:hypothetical protein BV20DRAFT_123089 [Pilatotrama ljubarskyi]